ncbi:YciI family protein [Kribbella sp. NPDC048928]|uniref:YciI family protein n=1 Tax=Kribbella sp. NPDC048928 TaxID=3364111 RepID=UPI0037110CB9
MKYVVLIHSNPQPWGHPTIDFTEIGKAVPADERAAMGKEFDEMLAELSASGELVSGLALDAPSTARTYRSDGRKPVSTDGPYAESKEQLAGFFVLDCATRDRAEELAAKFAGPGDVIELRPEMEF